LTYLYGDATESSLTSNYLELLRAMIDLSVAVLTGTEAIASYGREGRERRAATVLELEQLEVVKARLVETLDDCAAYATAPVSGRCVASVRDAALRDIERSRTEIESSLARELTRLEAAIAAQRAKNLDRLASFLLHHDLPEANQWVDVQMVSESAYRAELVGHAPVKVSWVIDLDIPADNLFAQPIRLDKIAGQLSVKVPEEAGWVRKTVKLKSYKLAKEHVIKLARTDGNTTLELRSAPSDLDNGFDFVFSPSGRPVRGVRIAKGVASEPFEIEAEDVDGLRLLFAQLAGAANDLMGHRRALKKARLDGKPIQEHASPRLLVERLVEQAAPVVQEITRHSLSPTELVLKRVLADDQRVEVFASKADLRAKLEPLSPELQSIFAPLGLGDPIVSKALPKAALDEPDHGGEPRIVFAPSIPPHKLASSEAEEVGKKGEKRRGVDRNVPDDAEEDEEVTVAAPLSAPAVALIQAHLARGENESDSPNDDAPTLVPRDEDSVAAAFPSEPELPPSSGPPPPPRRVPQAPPRPPPAPRRRPDPARDESVEIVVDDTEE
jgi:hypothetical protein